MNVRTIIAIGVTGVMLLAYPHGLLAEGDGVIILPAPQTSGGKPLMETLRERRSSSEFSPEELPPQILSDLLWAANGINRPESGRRTAPTRLNLQEIDIYVALAKGLYRYDAAKNGLVPVAAKDLRALTGPQPFVRDAPVNLVYVADREKMRGIPEPDIEFYSATDTGFVSENVYLYCASAGLVTVVRGYVKKTVLAKAMRLKDSQRIILAQTVGYPKNAKD